MIQFLRSLFNRRKKDAELDEELQAHLAIETQQRIEAGESPADAADAARRDFGNVLLVKETTRTIWSITWIEQLIQELRYAWRKFRKSPGFTFTALASLALCLGANLTIFAVINSVLLRPLPFPNAERLVSVYNTYPKANVINDGCSLTNYYERRGKIDAFAGMAAYREITATIGEPGARALEQITQVSPDFFSTLQVTPVLGRSFTEEETTYKTNKVAILTDAYWRQAFNADPNVLGHDIRVEGLKMKIVGILPPTFRFLSSKSRLYFPLAANPEEYSQANRHSGNSDMIARLKPEATLAQAQSQIDAHNAAVEADNPVAKQMADAGFRSLVVNLHADHVASIRPILLLLQAGALSLLIIGAVNLINLLIIRATGRIKELAVRQAIGASRQRIVAEVLIETTALTLTGGLLGLAVGAAGIRLLSVLGAELLPLGAYIHFDMRVALIAILGSIALGVLLGIPVAWYSLRGHSGAALHAQSRSTTVSRTAKRLRHGFLIAQISLTFVLLAGTGLLSLSLKNAMTVSPGFRAQSVLTGRTSMPWTNYRDHQTRTAFTERLLKELRSQPGVVSAGLASNIPLSGISNKSAATVKGYVLRPDESLRSTYSYSVTGDYFAALGFSLREGRFLTEADSRSPQRVCVIDEDFAHYYWPQGSAIGHQLFEGSEAGKDADAFTIVGVVGQAKQADLTDPTAHGAVYYPYGHRTDGNLFAVVRTRLTPEYLGATIRNAVQKIDPELPVNDVRSMEGRVADSLIARRSPALVASLFSMIALLLTAIGTYGVLSFAVAQRRREIGVRMALGADPGRIRMHFTLLAVRLLAGGTVLGIAGALIVGRGMQTILFQVPAIHIPDLFGTAIVLGLVSLAACLLPSHRASRISPMEALAEE